MCISVFIEVESTVPVILTFNLMHWTSLLQVQTRDQVSIVQRSVYM